MEGIIKKDGGVWVMVALCENNVTIIANSPLINPFFSCVWTLEIVLFDYAGRP